MQGCSNPILKRLHVTTMLTGMVCLASVSAVALPIGGNVAGGTASISNNGSTTTISQSSNRAIVNWQGFDVGSGESVNFNQPSTSAITLNRVTSGGASQIDGKITANGQVWLVNPQGMFFGAGSQVNVGGLLATTSNISDSNFMSGNDVFDQIGNALAGITNAGNIHIADGGLAALVGPNVNNSGVITADLGKVQLASGDTFAIDLYGDGLINLQASPAITSQLIDNSGTITANGGKVQITTAAENAINSLVNLDGIIKAGDIDIGGVVISHTGQMTADNNVTLTAKNIAQQGSITAGNVTEHFTGAYIDNAASQTTASNITITGGDSLFASGGYTAPGGNIIMAAGNMWLYAAALDASGTNGGGTILLGDTNTQNISVNFCSTFKTDAIDSGDGGHIKIWSTQSTTFGAATSARGGTTSGNGGLIEISSAGQDYVGGNTPDVSAPHGNIGTFLLDPHNITISDNSATGGGLAYFPLTNPDPGGANNGYGTQVVALANGNIVVVNYLDSFAASSSGAVYLFNGSTGALISTLTGSLANDKVGYGTSGWNGITALTGNNNFVIDSWKWANSAATLAGAVTWANGTTGVSGTVSSSNSLVGSQTNDYVGAGGVTALTNGNYVVDSYNWANGAASAAGAATWGNGATGITGTISSSNTLVGSQINDLVGASGVTALTNGNYVVGSYAWDNGATANVGAVTWGNGTTGITGTISSANSLIGSQANDGIGGDGIKALTNGNYVVASSGWANGATANAGAVTWVDGSNGQTSNSTNTISSANSLVGSHTNDQVGFYVVALANGNYVVASPTWANGAASQAGAVTWGDGAGGTTVGAVSSSNSLVGSRTGDFVGWDGVTALPNGNYVVGSHKWANGAVSNAGAVTFGCGSSSNSCGTNGITGAISSSNSLVGSNSFDWVGAGSITVLTNGNYVTDNSSWGGVGAVTWGSGTTGVSVTVLHRHD